MLMNYIYNVGWSCENKSLLFFNSLMYRTYRIICDTFHLKFTRHKITQSVCYM